MGLCESTEDKLARSISDEIDKGMRIAKNYAARGIVKLLLLGPGESGKSTVIRQIRILHANGFSEFEVNERRFVVYANTVRSMFEIVRTMQKYKLFKFDDQTLEVDAANLVYHVESGLEFAPIPDKVRLAIMRLWNEPQVREAYEGHGSDEHINENAKYFFENIERIASQNYRPTNQDILQTRMATTGIVKFTFRIRNLDFSIADVGGQRTQRRKWIHFFDDTNAIIFIAAINEYDQRLREDDKMNRLLESLALFDNIANCVFLSSVSIVLFLNKKDLFRQKIERIPLNKLFPSYQDGADYKKAVAFLRKQFHKLYRRDKQDLYSHVTCATDTKQLEKVFNAVLDTIMKENMRDSAI